MSTFVLKDTKANNTREFDTLNDAKEQMEELIEKTPAEPEHLEIEAPDTAHNNPQVREAAQNGDDPADTQVVEPEVTDGGTSASTRDDYYNDLPDEGKKLSENPVDWMPDHFVDTIQGVPTVNRMGYCVIAEQYGVSVTAEPVTKASETGFEYAEFQAIAEKDGQEYSGFGSAHVERQDGDDPYLLNELAETRALKRAVAWATGMGITAIEEMQGEL